MINVCIYSPTPEIRRKLALSTKTLLMRNDVKAIFYNLPSGLGALEDMRLMEQSDALVVDAAWQRTYEARRLFTRAFEIGLTVWKEHEIHHSLGEVNPDNSVQATVLAQIQKLKNKNGTIKDLP